MQDKNVKNLIYALVALISLTAGIYFLMPRTNNQFMETSVLTVLKAINHDLGTDEQPDLAIDSVSLQKISDPSPDFNYYKFNATVTIRNLGGTLSNSTVVIHGDDKQKYEFVRNTKGGFYLQKNGLFTIKNYEVLSDGNYNGGKVTLTIDVKDKQDSFISNNTYNVDLFEFPPAKIKSTGLKGISDDNSFVLNFDREPQDENLNFEIYTTKAFNIPESDLKYAEIYSNGKVYGYYRIKNSLDVINSKDWQKINDVQQDNLSVKFAQNPFDDIDEHYLYLKATDPKTGNYKVSNIIKLPRYKELTKDDFINYMVEYTGKNVVDKGIVYYKDVAGDDTYDTQVQSLYNSKMDSLTDSENQITRGDVLKTVMDFYNIPLSTLSKNAHFEDVSSKHPLYPYAETLYATGKWYVFGYTLNLDAPATKDFLDYLISEYKK